jgi:cupin superfamily acireductone dioxygenase involved in methionine salvage
MKNFDVYFEIYGKKMKVTVFAENEEKAKEMVKDSISFHKVVYKKEDEFNQVIEMMDSVIDALQKKRGYNPCDTPVKK